MLHNNNFMSVKTTLLLSALAIGAFGAAAQSVTVQTKGGFSHKFNTDYLKGLTVRETPQAEALKMTSIEVEPYGRDAVFTLKAENGTVVMFDAYTTVSTAYLAAGLYKVDPSNQPYTIGTDPEYTNVVKDGRTLNVVSGDMIVTNTKNDYRLDGNFELSDGSWLNFVWEGEMPSNYAPYFSATLVAAEYLDNPQRPGEFYIKLNDEAWNIAVGLDLQADASATTLPAGTYKLSATTDPGTYSEKSYVEIYTPYSASYGFDGTVTVTNEGNIYTIVIAAPLSTGQNAELTFKGEITGTPTFKDSQRPAALPDGVVLRKPNPSVLSK